ALLLPKLDRASEGQRTLEQVTELREEVARRWNKDVEAQRRLGRHYRLLGDHQRFAGQMGDAAVSLGKAQQVLEAVAKANPGLTLVHTELAECYFTKGQMCRQQSRFEESLEHLQKARGIQERLARQFPTVRSHQSELAKTYFQIGIAHFEQGDR